MVRKLSNMWAELQLKQVYSTQKIVYEIINKFKSEMSNFSEDLVCPACGTEWASLPFTSGLTSEISCYKCNQIFTPATYLKDTAINTLDNSIPDEMRNYDWSNFIRNVFVFIDDNIEEIFHILVNERVITPGEQVEAVKDTNYLLKADDERYISDTLEDRPEDIVEQELSIKIKSSLEELKKLLTTSSPDKKRILSLYESIADQYNNTGEFGLVKRYLYKAERVARELKEYHTIARIHSKIGEFFSLSDQDNAMKYYFNSSKILRKEKISDDRLCLINFKGLGNILYAKEKMLDAIKAYEKALECCKRLEGDNESQAVILNNMGNAYSILLDKKAAMKAYTASFETFANLNDKLNMGKTMNNIGLIIAEIGDLQKALEYFNRGKRYLQELKEPYEREGEEVIGMISINTAMIEHLLLQDPYRPLDLLREAIEIFTRHENELMITRSLLNLSELLYSQHDYVSATEYVAQAVKSFEESSNTSSTYFFKALMLYNRLLTLMKEDKRVKENLGILKEKSSTKLLKGDVILHEAELLRLKNEHQDAIPKYKEALKKEHSVQSKLRANLELGFYNLTDYREFPDPKMLVSAAKHMKIVNELARKESIVLLNLNTIILEAYIHILGKHFEDARNFLKQGIVIASEKNLEKQKKRINDDLDRVFSWEKEQPTSSKEMITLITNLVRECRDILMWY
ncbi:MAG: tetratricopeptide repeat protein [Candidatus Hodarchaeales archaeon]